MSFEGNRDICLYKWLADIPEYEPYMWEKLLQAVKRPEGLLGPLGDWEHVAEVLQRNPDVLDRDTFQAQKKRYWRIMTSHSCDGTPPCSGGAPLGVPAPRPSKTKQKNHRGH